MHLLAVTIDSISSPSHLLLVHSLVWRKKFSSKSNLPFSPKFSLEKFSLKPSLVAETVDPLLPFSSKFRLEKKIRSKPSLVVETVDPLLPFSRKFCLEKFNSKPSLVSRQWIHCHPLVQSLVSTRSFVQSKV